MPTLHRRLTDGGHYILVYVHGGGGCATFQVTAEGLAFLRTNRIDTDTGRVPLSRQLVEVMRTRGLIRTGGAGLTGDDLGLRRAMVAQSLLALLTSGGGAGQATQKHVGKAAHAALDTTPDGTGCLVIGDQSPDDLYALSVADMARWTLSVALPDLPLQHVPGDTGVAKVDVLTGLSLIVASGAERPLLDWWPGRAPAMRVAPRGTDYELEPRGSWPAALRRNWLPTRIAGLRSAGVLFHASVKGGGRVEDGAAVASGEGYVLVREVAGSRLLARPPATVRPVDLGTRDGWEAVGFTLSRDLDADARAWIGALGHSVRDALWSVTVVAPIEAATATGLPLSQVDRPCLLRMSAPRNACRLPHGAALKVVSPEEPDSSVLVEGDGWGTRYAVFVPARAGMYVVTGPGWLQPLLLPVVASSVLTSGANASPCSTGLRVDIGAVVATAFAASPTPLPLAELTVPAGPHGTPSMKSIEIAINCPAAHYTVRSGPRGVPGEVRSVSRETLAITIRGALQATPRHRLWGLTVDAGPAYGAVTFDVSWLPAGRAREHAAMGDARTARWMTAVYPELARLAAHGTPQRAHDSVASPPPERRTGAPPSLVWRATLARGGPP